VCVSIGLTIRKIPTVGVVYNPIMNEVSNELHQVFMCSVALSEGCYRIRPDIDLVM
jgi:hypothetical protein